VINVKMETSSAVLALRRAFVDVLIDELRIICFVFLFDRPAEIFGAIFVLTSPCMINGAQSSLT
jgi:hypothetical protein